ncbi:MAG: FecR family protein [Pseudomonadota bacterium]
MTDDDAQHDPIQEEAIEWLMRLSRAPEDETLRRGLADWRRRSDAHDKAFKSVETVWQLAEDLPQADVSHAPAKVFRRASESPTFHRDTSASRRTRRGSKARRRERSRRWVAFGAVGFALSACLVFLLVPFANLRIQADHITETGETRTVRLEDGSALHLAADSAVAIDFMPRNRSVRLLAGQAFFDVAHDAARPFSVTAGDLIVTVTGTRFAVAQNSQRVAVAVASGSVRVDLDKRTPDTISLEPGDRLAFAISSGERSLSKLPPNDIAAWRSGQLVAHNATLADVVEEIGRYHHGSIWLKDESLAQRRVTGVFNLNSPAAALEAAVGVHGADILDITPYFKVIRQR